MIQALSRRGGVEKTVTQALAVMSLAISVGLFTRLALSANLLRWFIAVIFITLFLVLTVTRPRAAALGVLGYLGLLAAFRRLLIPLSPFTAFDPLLLVGPSVAVALIARAIVVERARVAPDALSKMVLAVVALSLVEIANPLGGGVTVGATGFLFVGVPLLWFFVGREVAEERFLRRLLALALLISLVNVPYGLIQTGTGLPAWDQAWVAYSQSVGGYAALNVGGVLRAFGTFSSSSEYATFLAMGLVITVIHLTYRRWWSLPLIPPLAWALVLASTRTVVVLALLAVVVVLALRTRLLGRALLVIAAALVLVGGIEIVFGAQIARVVGAADPLTAHQVLGLVRPFDPTQSTLGTHVNLMIDGVIFGLSHPAGLGLGSTSIAASRLGGAIGATEFDISNAFVSLGIMGGGLFFAIVMASIVVAVRLAYRRQDPVWMLLLGVLIVTFGQWLNGGLYLVSALVWILIGAATGATERSRRARGMP